MSYLSERFKKFNSELFTFDAIDTNNKKPVTRTLLSVDESDNILIHYHLLNGHPWTFHSSQKKMSQKYIRVRYKKPFDGIKYKSPKGAGLLPFFPPGLIKKYLAKEKIETLVLIEGEIKSIIADNFGLDCIGLGSIHGFYAPQDESRPHYKEFAPEILEVIQTCRVKNLVYLTDADTLSLNYKVDTDLRKRPNSFYKAVLNFRNITKRVVFDPDSNLREFFFAHIRPVYNPKSKGIDDLIENEIEQGHEICAALKAVSRESKWFKIESLKEMQETHLKKYFGLQSPENFHDVYENILADREFVFKKSKYFYDGEKVKLIKNLALDDYMRVGSNYFKVIDQVRYVEEMVITSRVIVGWNKGEISTDHGVKCLALIKKYDAFANIPNWIRHQKIIRNNYNLCAPIPYTPTAGNFPNFGKFIQHIASDDNFISIDKKGAITENPITGSTGTMLLDYLSIMVQRPTHSLPVPCFLSREQETGKTTFAQFIAKMFEGNSAILQTKDFFADFNSYWAGKFFLCIDEGKFEDKRASKEKLKYVTTADQLVINEKGISQKPIDNFAKVMVCSNDEDDFIQLEKSDNRFWILKVKSIQKKDPDLKFKMFREIPQVFHYLANREIHHPRLTRTWFDHDLILNDNFKRMLGSSKAHWKQEIDSAIEHVFDSISEEEFKAAPIDIVRWLKTFNKTTKVTNTQVIQYLKRENDMVAQPSGQYTSYIIQDGTFTVEPVWGTRGRAYVFHREQWGSQTITNPLKKQIPLKFDTKQ